MRSPARHSRPSAKLKSSVLVFLLLAAVARADPDGGRWALMVEPSFMDHSLRTPIEGSRRTTITVAREQDGAWVPLPRGARRSVAQPYPEIERQAWETLRGVLAEASTRILRDQRGTARFAMIESQHPLTASTVLLPEFGERFRDTLGPDLLVAMPDRFTVYVFSRQGIEHEAMKEPIIAAYLAATYPVSREIFSWENGRLRALRYLQ
jgi:hypothetical protein